MTDEQPQPRKILRAVIGVLLIAGMACGYWSMGRQRSAKQNKASERLEQCGGRVYLEYEWRDGAPDPQPIPPTQTWARRTFGDTWFDRVVAVDLTNVQRIDEAMPMLRWLPYLESVNARSTPMGDEAMRSLEKVTSPAR